MEAQTTPRPVRELLAKALEWKEAHASLDDAVSNVPRAARGRTVENFPHTLWQLLEHVRISQADLLEFCTNPQYREMDWPADYWPDSPQPPDDAAWENSIAAIRRDRDALRKLALDPARDLASTIPHGTGQTYLRELLLAIDHTAYHVGQMIALRRQLGAWEES